MISPSFFRIELFEPLPARVQIGRNEYPTLELCRVLEVITDEAIIKKGSNSLRNGWRNCTVEIKVIQPENLGDPLKIIGKENKQYELISVW